jgi:hypothetical protein
MRGEPRIWGGYLLEVEGKYHELLSVYGLPNAKIDRQLRRRVINPANQWQRIEIVARPGRLECSLNGVVISSGDLPPDAELQAGYIALQSQGRPMEWRNVRIKEE